MRWSLALALVLSAFFAAPAMAAADKPTQKVAAETLEPPPGAVAYQDVTKTPAYAYFAANGIQVTALGRKNGMDHFLGVKNGKTQAFAITPDGEAIIIGWLHDAQGADVTSQLIVQALTGNRSNDMITPVAPPPPAAAEAEQAPPLALASLEALPSEPVDPAVLKQIAETHYVEVGQAGAPLVYALFDPACVECGDAWMKLEPLIDRGQARVRLVLFGALSPESTGLVASVLASPTPGDRYRDLVRGDRRTSQVTPEIYAKLKKNHDFGNGIGLRSFPTWIWEGPTGARRLAGTPSDMAAFIAAMRGGA